jgi:hypothetical protein
LIGSGKGFRVSWSLLHVTGTASVTYKLILGSSTVTGWSTADVSFQHNGTHEIINQPGVQNAQNSRNTVLTNIVQVLNANPTLTENTANPITIKLTFNVANTDQVQGNFWLIELIQ